MKWKLALAACASLVLAGQALGAAPPEQLRLWRKGIVIAKADAGFAFMAANQGFGERHGLKIQISQFTNDTLMMRALIAGQIDSYDGSPGAAMVAFARGADVRITGCQWPVLTYGLFVRPNVTSAAALRGKRVGISAPGALPELLARIVLEQNNVPRNSVTFAPMGGDADRFAALSAGVVDAVAVSTEMSPVAATQGLKLLVHAADAMPNYIRFCTYMGRRTITERKETAAHYLAAEMEALRYALANRDAEIALTRRITRTPATDPRPAFIFDEIARRKAIDPTMAIPAAKLRWMQDLLLRTKDLPKPVVPQVIDETVRTRALQLVR
jgi:NitT/TauT family transport system substrate-binding protein